MPKFLWHAAIDSAAHHNPQLLKRGLIQTLLDQPSIDDDKTEKLKANVLKTPKEKNLEHSDSIQVLFRCKYGIVIEIMHS